MVVAAGPTTDCVQGHWHEHLFQHLSAGQVVVLEEEHAECMHLAEHGRDLVQDACDSWVVGSDISLVLVLGSIGRRNLAAAELSKVLQQAVLGMSWA